MILNEIGELRSTILIQGYDYTIKRALVIIRSRIAGRIPENSIPAPIRKEIRRKRYRSFIDIGAAKGDTLFPIAREFDKCLAVEPMPENVKVLRSIISSYDVRNCSIASCALGKASDETAIYTDRGNDNSILRRSGLIRGPNVRVRTLDDLVAEFDLKEPILIKIDVQGSEFDVFRGGLNTLAKDCVVFSEFWPYGLRSSGCSPNQYLAFLKERGFIIHNLSGRPIPDNKIAKFLELNADSISFTDLMLSKAKDRLCL